MGRVPAARFVWMVYGEDSTQKQMIGVCRRGDLHHYCSHTRIHFGNRVLFSVKREKEIK